MLAGLCQAADGVVTVRIRPAPQPRRPDVVRTEVDAGPVAVLPQPGEFTPQAALLLGCNEIIEFYPRLLVDVVRAVGPRMPIIALVQTADQGRRSWALLRKHNLPTASVFFTVVPMNSMWVRDYGPFFVRLDDDTVAVADAEYDTLHTPDSRRDSDNRVPDLLGRAMGLPTRAVPLRYEGGNLLHNGEGVCLSTVKILARNGGAADPRPVGRALREHLGVRRWLYTQPLADEPTGHVDMYATFVAADLAVVAECDPNTEPANAAVLDEAAKMLAGVRTSAGPMRVERIVTPPRKDGHWRTYTNVVFANGTLLVPSFSDVPRSLEAEAMDLYRRLLPGWKVVGINVDEMVPHHGLLHCVCMNVPRYVSLQTLVARVRRPARPETAASAENTH